MGGWALERNVECCGWGRSVFVLAAEYGDAILTMLRTGPAHAVYFATYEAVKHLMGGNQAGVHHPLAAATSGACATIASDALMNPFDGTCVSGPLHGRDTLT
jgi:hypothetical protein